MTFLTTLSSCFSNCYYPIFIYFRIKFQVVISTVVIFETIFYRVTSYSLSIKQRFLCSQFISSTNYTYFAWYSKCGGGGDILKVIFHIKDEKFRIFGPLFDTPWAEYWDCLFQYFCHTFRVPISSEGEKILPSNKKLYCLVGSYCIISLHFYFIMSGIVFVFVCFLDHTMCIYL